MMGIHIIITGVWIGGFFIANDSYNARMYYILQNRNFQLVNLTFYQPSEAILVL